MHVELSDRARRVLETLQPAASPGAAIEAVALDALRLRLRECLGEIGAFEARYGRSFEQLEGDWRSGEVADRRSHEAERDYMEWEALTMERSELLSLIRELSAPVGAAV